MRSTSIKKQTLLPSLVIPFPQLDPGGAAKAWFFRGTYPEALDKAKFGAGAQINFKTELDHSLKGGQKAQEAPDHLGSVGAPPRARRPPGCTPS